jgi:hypothetical protein
MMHGAISSHDLSNILKVPIRTIDRDKQWLNGFLNKSFQDLVNSYPSIHQSVLLAHYDIMATAWRIIDSPTAEDNTKIAAGYLALSTLSKIMELSGSGAKMVVAAKQRIVTDNNMPERPAWRDKLKRAWEP